MVLGPLRHQNTQTFTPLIKQLGPYYEHPRLWVWMSVHFLFDFKVIGIRAVHIVAPSYITQDSTQGSRPRGGSWQVQPRGKT